MFNAEEELKKINTMESDNAAWSTENREKLEAMRQGIQNNHFSYDPYSDKIYQQYKKNYTNQAKMAMKDSMANAASLTGGYGNSYAATVGNQAYNAQMDKLNDVIPELYDIALARYNSDISNAWKGYSAAAAEYERELGIRGDALEQARNKYLLGLEDQNSKNDFLYSLLESGETDINSLATSLEYSGLFNDEGQDYWYEKAEDIAGKNSYEQKKNEIMDIISKYGLMPPEIETEKRDIDGDGNEDTVEVNPGKDNIPEELINLTDYLYNNMGYGTNNTWNQTLGLAKEALDMLDSGYRMSGDTEETKHPFQLVGIKKAANIASDLMTFYKIGGVPEMETYISGLDENAQKAAAEFLTYDDNGNITGLEKSANSLTSWLNFDEKKDGYGFYFDSNPNNWDLQEGDNFSVVGPDGKQYFVESGGVVKDKDVLDVAKYKNDNNVFKVRGKLYMKKGEDVYLVRKRAITKSDSYSDLYGSVSE